MRSEKAISMSTLPKMLQHHRIAAVAHGFRSSFRDWAAEETDHPREVIEAALAHVVQNKVEAAYARSDMFERRRLLMDDWGSLRRPPARVVMQRVREAFPGAPRSRESNAIRGDRPTVAPARAVQTEGGGPVADVGLRSRHQKSRVSAPGERAIALDERAPDRESNRPACLYIALAAADPPSRPEAGRET